ncbi:M48 family metallopeptidase [Streptomyces sp. NRRL F-5123]|uniref:M48 family metallopeptidase n=1 Tax=Streptomyces sp. NRRL F-5123 TaxID=1463856 RepID=UPI0005BCB19B|nr:M48 family metallopeptidase [Streptomyces sp. NRRL F-5123]
MNQRLRAAGVFALLVGFFVTGFVLLAAMAVFDWLLATHRGDGSRAGFTGVFMAMTAVAAAGILRGMYAFLRAGRLGTPEGVAVTEQDEPELWAEVRAVADGLGERPPQELCLTSDVNASAAEQSRLLGLLPGRRRLNVGVPLLVGMERAELRAVLAHEFGHYGNGDTRLGAAALRGRAAMAHTVRIFSRDLVWFDRVVGAIYLGYARMYLRRSFALSREKEFAADRVAAGYAGAAAMTAALRTLPVVDAAHAHYLETYATMGRPFRALPPAGEFHGGFRRMVDARPGERLAALAEGRRPKPPHKYDTHPSLAERLARLEALPAQDADPVTAGPAFALLRAPERVLTALEAAPDAAPEPATPAEVRRLSWDHLVLVRAAYDAEEFSRPLRQAVARVRRTGAGAELPDLEDVLDAFDEGLLWAGISDRMPRPQSAARLTGESARNYLRPAVFDALAGLVHLRLLAASRAVPRIAWAGTPGIGLPEAWEKGMDAALDAATSDTPDTKPLRALLAEPDPDPEPAPDPVGGGGAVGGL